MYIFFYYLILLSPVKSNDILAAFMYITVI